MRRRPTAAWRSSIAVGSTMLLALTSAVLGSVATAAGAGASPTTLAQARKDLLTLADMPAGWTSTKNPNTGTNSLGDAQLAHCIGVATSLVSENPPSVNSRQFQNTQGTLLVGDNVTVFPSATNAAAEYALAHNPKLAGCMTTVASGPLKTKLFGKPPKGTTIGTPLVSPVAPSAFGTGVAGYAMSVPVTAQGVTLNVTVTQLVTVKGRLGHQVTFTSVGAPFSMALQRQIMAVAAKRL
ncbi:MAG: hypothetical protein WAL61_12760 [Acidimicrobiales bacterium]